MPDLASRTLAFLEQRALALPVIPMLQPADPFLDTAGEALRRRIFLSEGETGETLCLRPEFTIPVCRHHIASAADTPARYGYCGPVFRQKRQDGPAGANEFVQAGIEDLGDADHAAADARSLADALALIAALAPGLQPRVMLGDEALFGALLKALKLPDVWAARLLRFFGDAAKLDAALKSMGAPVATSDRFAGMNRAALIAALEPEMEAAGLLEAGGRTPEDIAERILEKRALAQGGVSASARAVIALWLKMEANLGASLDAIDAFARAHRLHLDGARDAFAARLKAIRDAGVDVTRIRFSAAFGRPLDYYSSMQFEAFAPGGTLPLAGGGRYDRLLTLLGAARPIPGVGFSLWLDRVQAAAGRPSS
ncbi:MAG: ATP phosphoribosyltransferase regulatory subunit [Rhizobiaceae bacterium]|jgi:ATP phosphoribosyltransferase regulatory subunit|nr:ATP phosphoribosyltransferase regulatory subunit [Rhizobiaceae bacterium]